MDSHSINDDLDSLFAPSHRPVGLVSFNSREASKLPQYGSTIGVTLGGFIAGTIIAWSSPAAVSLGNGAYDFPVTKDDESWIGSIMPLGAILGCIFTGLLVDTLGRKNLMIAMVTPCTIGWCLILWAKSFWMICVGRLILGMTCGSFTIICPMYTAEICEKELRGTLGTIFQLQVVCGILYVYILGSLLSLFSLTLVCLVLPTIYLVLICLIPESPVYLVKRGNFEEAKRSLQWLRGSHYDITFDIAELMESADRGEAEKVLFSIAIRSRVAIKGLVIGLGAMFFQQFSGVNAVIFYAASIFKDAGSSFDYNVSSIIVGSVCVVFTYLATLIIEKLGRRILLLFSSIVMTISTTSLGIYFYALNNSFNVSSIQFVPIISLCAFVIAFSVGFGPIPFMLVGEIFSPLIKGTGSSIVCLFNWFCAFLVTKYFCTLSDEFGKDATFLAFSVFSSIGIFFVYYIVPETKGKSLEEVQELLAS